MDTLGTSAILNKGDNFFDFLFALQHTKFPSEKGSTLKGKNLLPWLDFGDLDLIFKVRAIEKLKIHGVGTSFFLWKYCY